MTELLSELHLDLCSHLGSSRNAAQAVLLAVIRLIAPARFGLLVGGGHERDRVGEYEGGEEPKPEQAYEFLAPGLFPDKPCVPHADRGQVSMNLVLGESRARVGDRERPLGQVPSHANAASIGPRRVLDPAPDDRVVGVLHKFAQRDFGRRIQMFPQYGHETAQVHIRRVYGWEFFCHRRFHGVIDG